MQKFWNWTTFKNESEEEERELRLEGVIAEDSWFGDEVTPAVFRDELMGGTGHVTVSINSPGGDCIAASQIYTMLKDYKGGVTVKVDGIAASAASVISMAGDRVLMAPTAVMMIHNPMTVAYGNRDDMKQAIKVLDEVKESIMNAYEMKTGLDRARISQLMDNETWMNAHKAKELGFIDEIMFEDKCGDGEEKKKPCNAYTFSQHRVDMALANKLTGAKHEEDAEEPPVKVLEAENENTKAETAGADADMLYDRLMSKKYF